MFFDSIKTEDDLEKLKRRMVLDKKLAGRLLKIKKKINYRGTSAKYRTLPLPTNAEVLALYREMTEKGGEEKSPALERLLRKRKTKSNSGIVAVSLLTKPFPCPGNCLYCPTEREMPKSYLSLEPAAARALRNNFSPYKQVLSRLKALDANGHPLDKAEIIIIGGTWNFYTRPYRNNFVSEIFRACDNFGRSRPIRKGEKTLAELQKINERAKCRIVGISVETRPDFINENELMEMRKLGVTKVEIGVQHLDDEILKKNRRAVSANDTARATELLRSFGFKIVYHMMPGLYGSSPAKDLAAFKKLFSDKRFFPDMLKIYPCVVLKSAGLYGKWKKGEHRPYSERVLIKLLAEIKKIIPPYVRIIRLIRDIPGTYIAAGSKISNLRQYLASGQRTNGWKCLCLRCREIREEEIKLRDFKLKKIKYAVSGGEEIFLSFENKKGDKLAAFLRLFLPDSIGTSPGVPDILKNSALIRELHTYGRLAPISQKGEQSQHMGLGKALVGEAEKIARKAGFKKMAIISGVGVRGYYKKLGFRLKNTYMIKAI